MLYDLDKTIETLGSYFENIFDEFYQPTDSDERVITQAHINKRNVVWKKEYEDRLSEVGFRLYKPEEDVY